jgi:DNA-binding CsgD family transcriptional regulator
LQAKIVLSFKQNGKTLEGQTMDSHIVYTMKDYQQGYTQIGEVLHCLYCDQTYRIGVVYPQDQDLLTAPLAMQAHLARVHQGALAALFAQGRESLGLAQAQFDILQLQAKGLTDTVIAQRMGISTSTVRNHRFKLREKERQATRFLAVLNNMHDGQKETLLPHPGATQLDERYDITPKEQQQILKNLMDEKGWISTWPSKEKRKLVLLAKLSEDLAPQKNYSEQAVNEILQQHVADYVTVRRYLIEYGFLQRTRDGRTYWV